MSFEMLKKLSDIAYVSAAFFFVLSIVLFFALNVPKLFGDITGLSKKRAINSYRKNAEKIGADEAEKKNPPTSAKIGEAKTVNTAPLQPDSQGIPMNYDFGPNGAPPPTGYFAVVEEIEFTDSTEIIV